MGESSKPAGFGSIWNSNSWFYEEKNYTKFAKEWLTKNLKNISHQREDVIVVVGDVKTIEGTASVTIRKQKQIFLFDLEIELYFSAERQDQSKYDHADEK